MGIRVLVLSKENVLLSESDPEDVIVWDYMNAPKDYNNYYIGHIMGDYCKSDIKDPRIRYFKHLFSQFDLVFSGIQLKELSKEVETLEDLGLINKEDLEVIKLGIKEARDKGLSLRFEYE